MNRLICEKINEHIYVLKTVGNNAIVGEFDKIDNNCFYFRPDDYNNGYFESDILREIANKLDEINRPWKNDTEEYFNT